jgi:hypothetical protein
MVDWKKTFAPVENLFDRLWNFAGKSISVLVAVSFMIFTLGSLFGYFIAMHAGKFGQEIALILIVPPVLGLLAYYYRTFAIICFILFLLLILI